MKKPGSAVNPHPTELLLPTHKKARPSACLL
jgi:hypothetical protein